MFHNKSLKINAIQLTGLLTRDGVILRNWFDSILIDDGTKNIKTGDMLGELTNELSGETITEFVSTGPKSYSFKYGDNKHEHSQWLN